MQMIKLTAIFFLVFSGVTTSIAQFSAPSFWNGGSGDRYGSISPMAAPEIDPGSAVSALTLLLGGVTVLRGRVKK
jgi:hypothetical protein